ncbi:hypothetical protein H0G86_004342 [Trichoderma simmonsii]|uniref:Uncharacterized protein n=1 Tax=Trichoderma simmonsii TaxID=1491479 RepID=A0A8G0L7K3_9HYPO|nr:hypothetical protein H0G86_004342 [Trichoderma simmonsii]
MLKGAENFSPRNTSKWREFYCLATLLSTVQRKSEPDFLRPEASTTAGARRWWSQHGLAASRHQAPPHVQNFQASSDRLALTTTKLCSRLNFITKRVGHRVWRLETPRKRRYEPPTCDLRVQTALELVATGETCREVLLGLVARTGDREGAISQQRTTASTIDSSVSSDRHLSPLENSSVFLRALHLCRDCEARALSAALTDPFRLP